VLMRMIEKQRNSKIFFKFMAKDFRNIEYHTNQDGDGLRYYACSTLNTKQKELIFHKNKGAIVQIRWEVKLGKDIKNLSETFNFTPEFGEFVEYQNYLFYHHKSQISIQQLLTNLIRSIEDQFLFQI